MMLIVGIAALLLAVVSYGVYIRNTLIGHTKPHAITWLIWSTLNGFVFVEQMMNNAGPGAYVTGGAAIANFFIFVLSLKYGERSINRLDWLCLGLVGIMLSFWFVIDDATISVTLAVIISFLGFLPTILKARRNAHEETALTFALNGIKFLLSFTALTTVTVATALYPLALFVMNTSFALYLVIARRHQPKKKPTRTKRRV